MAKKQKTAISPTRTENYPEWYQQAIRASDMAELSPVRGCMVIKPWGYALWENIRRELDERFRETGVKNAYFPLFIPITFLEKEAEHVEGFAKECAVVTHHKLEKGENGKLVPGGPLTEPLIVRPTSETIIGDSFARWVSSYRDLPMLINQWANVVRWEMRTRIFLRTSEFLWQEGHTVHATKEEAKERTYMMLDIYRDVAESVLAMPVVCGEKSESEKFPGAETTLCIEAMMQDRKALQAGTSHFLGQNFAKASNIRFQTADKGEEYAWTTSWGVSTRLIGGLIMTHGDDDGIILPPRIASSHVVLMPIIRKDTDAGAILTYTHRIADALKKKKYHGRPVCVEIDSRQTGGARNWEWIKKGIPVRVEIGPRDMAENAVYVARRDASFRDAVSINRDRFIDGLPAMLDEIQQNLFNRAVAFRNANTRLIDEKEEFNRFFTPENPDRPGIHGGFALSCWCGSKACEEAIKQRLNVTIRCIPNNLPEAGETDTGTCIECGQKACRRVVFAKAY